MILSNPNLVEGLALTYSQCITLDLLPWVQVVRQSYARAFELREVTPAWTVEALEEFVFVMLDDPDEYLDQFMSLLVEPIESSATMLAVFRGDAPYTNENLKKLASQDLPAPNNSFVVIYDTLVQLSEIISDDHTLLSRHWNNKGNSMEACTLLLAEGNYRDVVVVPPTELGHVPDSHPVSATVSPAKASESSDGTRSSRTRTEGRDQPEPVVLLYLSACPVLCAFCPSGARRFTP